MQGRPMAIAPGRETHIGVLMCGPPFTATWVERADATTSLCIRFPIILWTEADAVILPPDDANGFPFYVYVDPPDRPGMHRDLFKQWGRRVAGELQTLDYPMSADAKSHLSTEYLSDCGESLPSDDSMS